MQERIRGDERELNQIKKAGLAARLLVLMCGAGKMTR